MRKKQVVFKMTALIEEMNSLQKKLALLEAENRELRKKVDELESLRDAEPVAQVTEERTEEANEGFSVELVEEETSETEESFKPSVQKVELEDEIMEYGSVAIGRVVQESVKYANVISASESLNKKELLNLIMGRAEVAKSEIFAATESEGLSEVKRGLIDSAVSDAIDYFKSVAGQI